MHTHWAVNMKALGELFFFCTEAHSNKQRQNYQGRQWCSLSLLSHVFSRKIINSALLLLIQFFEHLRFKHRDQKKSASMYLFSHCTCTVLLLPDTDWTANPQLSHVLVTNSSSRTQITLPWKAGHPSRPHILPAVPPAPSPQSVQGPFRLRAEAKHSPSEEARPGLPPLTRSPQLAKWLRAAPLTCGCRWAGEPRRAPRSATASSACASARPRSAGHGSEPRPPRQVGVVAPPGGAEEPRPWGSVAADDWREKDLSGRDEHLREYRCAADVV